MKITSKTLDKIDNENLDDQKYYAYFKGIIKLFVWWTEDEAEGNVAHLLNDMYQILSQNQKELEDKQF